MISNTLPFFSLVFCPPHTYTLFCPHPLLFLFLYFHTSTFQKLLILSFFPLLFFLYFHLIIPKLSGSLNFFSFFFFFSTWFSEALHFCFLTYMKQIARRPELNIEKPHDLEVIGYGIKSEPNTVGSVFLRLPLLLLSFCLSACLWLFGCGFGYRYLSLLLVS